MKYLAVTPIPDRCLIPDISQNHSDLYPYTHCKFNPSRFILFQFLCQKHYPFFDYFL